MPKFAFRLQRLLDYRVLQEKWARDAFLAARARRLEAEEDSQTIQTNRSAMIRGRANDLGSRLTLEYALNRLDDDLRAHEAVIGVLADEENQSHDQWLKARQEREALEKLREKALDQYKVEQMRLEQAELDEWTTSRSATG